MARSKRHSPISGMSKAKTNKKWKRESSRKLRRAVKIALKNDNEILPKMLELANPYVSPKDGYTTWWNNPPHLWAIPQPEWKVMMK